MRQNACRNACPSQLSPIDYTSRHVASDSLQFWCFLSWSYFQKFRKRQGSRLLWRNWKASTLLIRNLTTDPSNIMTYSAVLLRVWIRIYLLLFRHLFSENWCLKLSSVVQITSYFYSIQRQQSIHTWLSANRLFDTPECEPVCSKYNSKSLVWRMLSCVCCQAVVMRTWTQFGKRAFSVCGPSIWNQIPPHIRNLHSVPAFRKPLKTYLFSEII